MDLSVMFTEMESLMMFLIQSIIEKLENLMVSKGQ